MAIIGITPTFMSPIAYRNFAPELEQQTRSNAAGLRQLADFATKAYDYNKNRQIGDALKRGNVNEAAELESQKINQQDPTMLWRWKAGQDQQQAQINAANAQRIADEQKAKQNLMNETESLLSNVVTDNPEAMAQYINNLNTQKAKLRNMGIDTKIVDDKIKQMTDAMQGKKDVIAEQAAADKEIKDSATLRDTAMKLSSTDAQKFLNDNKSAMTQPDINQVEQYIKNKKLEEKQKRQGEVKADQEFAASQEKKAAEQSVDDIKF